MVWVIVLLYIVCLIGYAAWSSRSENRADFVIGSRHYGPLPIAFSLVTSWFSAGGLILYAILSKGGLLDFLALTTGAVAALVLLSFFTKEFYNRAVEKHYITFTEYVIGDLGKMTGLCAIIFIPILFLLWFLFELIASGQFLAEITVLNYIEANILIGSVVGIYLILGGFKILMNSDFLQASLLFFFFLLTLFHISDVPFSQTYEYIGAQITWNWKTFLAGFFSFFAGVCVGADVWQRILAARSAISASRGLRLAALFYPIVYIALLVLLSSIYVVSPDFAPAETYKYLIFDYAGPLLAALLLTTFIAAIMSTLDTVLFITAQGFSTDVFYFFGKRIQKPRLALRITTAIIIIGTLITSYYVRDVEAVFWFLVSIWVCLTPCMYLFFTKYTQKPRDLSCASTIIIIAAVISLLYALGKYEDYYVAYSFLAGLVLPKMIDSMLSTAGKRKSST